METSQLQQDLQTHFEFDETDLAANRLGEFSERQKRALKTDKKDSKRSSILVGAIFSAIGLFLLYLLFGTSILGGPFDLFDILNNLPATLIALAFFGVSILSFYGGIKTAPPSKHKVCKAEGPAEVVGAGHVVYRYPHRRVAVYELKVAKQRFNVYPDLPKVIAQGDVYAVYYDSADDEILSVEWISKG